ncbi:TfoX/Sxy family protein [Portibacter lacus]|uniref:RNA methyltransferase n=1 Tax=Portibacter lacus TaxID=1099794 RepID=A0AA37SV17_9BACT|nr:TfoX/Sxy family protein [Portibacter lacus]GLR20134.1 RNA methyltransferase [Portibacter lacus]
MAYDEHLGDRISIQLEQKKITFQAKKMFGGLCFMVNDKMCVGINGDTLMIRIDPELEKELKLKEGVRDMNFTGRPMKGFLYVNPEAIDNEEGLRYFIDKALEYNPIAKSSKKKKK